VVRERTLLIDETNKLEKVKKFLNSKLRKSEQTKNIYAFSLYHFQTFLSESEYKEYDVESILIPLNEKKLDVYSLLDDFVGYLTTRVDLANSNTKLSEKSIWLYMAGVRSYLEYNDIDISSRKFRIKVGLPSKYKRKEEPIDEEDIRIILLSCSDPRLKAFLLVLASSGMRAMEALSLRNRDVDFSESPTKIHIKAEKAKTKADRITYISDEASNELKRFFDVKYGDKNEFMKKPSHFIFTKDKQKPDSINPRQIYGRLHYNFAKLLKKVEMDKRKDGQGRQRREITLHSLRRFVYTTLCSSEGGQAYAEDFLGHSGSVYHTEKQEKKRERYIRCMKFLTFLDYPTIKAVGRDLESKLEERAIEIELIKSEHQKYKKEMDLKLEKIVSAIQQNPKLGKIKVDVLKKKINV
jgi:integrase